MRLLILCSVLISATLADHCNTAGSHPYVNGPKPTEKIAIVGAGPAGIHMAYELKKRGFQHVTVFEKSCVIGGKSRTVERRGAVHDLGTVYMQPDYQDNVIQLASELGYSELKDLVAPSVWSTPINVPQPLNSYFLFETLVALGTTDILYAVGQLAQQIYEYIFLHQTLFGSYSGELMPRPSAPVLHRIRGTAQEFLQRENLNLLKPLFLASHTIQGYGKLNNVTAFYILLWNTPKLMQALLLRLAGAPSIGVFLFKDGFQGLWEKAALSQSIEVKYGIEIVKVVRTQTKVILLAKNEGLCAALNPPEVLPLQPLEFDFVMWTPELQQSLDTIIATKLEESLFSTTYTTTFTTTLIDETGALRGDSPVDFFFNNINGLDNDVWAHRDSFSTIANNVGESYRSASTVTGNDGQMELRTCVAYQMSDRSATDPGFEGDLMSKLNDHYSEIGGSIVKNQTFSTRYFPRYPSEGIQAGIPWNILEAQGCNKMWYIGSSVIFESAKSVMEYNKLLLDRMVDNEHHCWKTVCPVF